MEKQEREEENKTNKEHLAAVDLSKITKKVPVPLIEDEPRTTIGENKDDLYNKLVFI